MTNDGKIYIIVTDERPIESNVNNQVVSSNKGENKNNSLMTHLSNEMILNNLKGIVAKDINYRLSNVGNFTGDYIAQTNINNALSFTNALSNIGMSGLSTFMATGNPALALMSAGVSLANTIVNRAFNVNSLMIENQKTNYEIAQLKDRAGLNSKLDGSRGTEN